jgi:hypothetical protein
MQPLTYTLQKSLEHTMSQYVIGFISRYLVTAANNVDSSASVLISLLAADYLATNS